jgi:transcriptional regulator with XRE-family HTH domain
MGSSRPETARLAEKLRDIRESFGLSQAQMVDRLKDQKLPAALRLYAGNISRFEQGLREPPLLVLLAYAKAAVVTIEVLIDAHLELPRRFLANVKGTEGHKSEERTAERPRNRNRASSKKRPLKRRSSRLASSR